MLYQTKRVWAKDFVFGKKHPYHDAMVRSRGQLMRFTKLVQKNVGNISNGLAHGLFLRRLGISAVVVEYRGCIQVSTTLVWDAVMKSTSFVDV